MAHTAHTAHTAQLDPEIEVLVLEAHGWIACARVCAQALGISLPRGIESLKRQESRIYTGYMPEVQRRAVRRMSYSNGLKFPERCPTLSDPQVIKAKAAKLYGPL